MTKQTGATEQQIEDAANRWIACTCPYVEPDNVQAAYATSAVPRMRSAASFLVPPGMVIAPENRVLDEAALRITRETWLIVRSYLYAMTYWVGTRNLMEIGESWAIMNDARSKTTPEVIAILDRVFGEEST